MSKICIVSPSLKMGGIERALVTLANQFNHTGHEIHFVICLRDNEFYELQSGIIVHRPKFKNVGGVINKLLFYPGLLRYIRKEVSDIQPDRVLVYGDLFSPITLLALLNTNNKVFISDRTIPDYKFKWPIRFLKSWLYPKSAGFIAQTTRAAEYKRKQFGEKLNIRVIPNALPELNQPVLNDSEKNKSILYVGRFAWEKDPEILIRAFKIVSKEFPEWRLIMAGDGPLFSKMKDLTNELGLQNQIEFLGKVKHVENLYASASIYVLPSVVEGFPNSLIEAMSFELPCICFSDIPYEDVVVHEKNGIVVNKRQETELAKGVSNLIINLDLRSNIGATALEWVKKFESEKVSSEILKFIEAQ